MRVSWTALKNFMTAKSIGLHGTHDDDNYYLLATDNSIVFECILAKSNTNDDLTDFTTNYLPTWNAAIVAKTAVQATPPFGSKTIVVNVAGVPTTKNLFARFTGLQFAVNTGANTLTYTATYPWAKMLGIETVGGVAGDTADLKVFDTAAGTYSGTPNALLNQFAYTINVAPNFYNRMAQFDADLYQGMIVQITYNVATLLVINRFLGINLLMNEVKS